MALIKSLGLLVASIFAAALSRMAVEEIGAWTPSITRRLIKCAVLRLPENLRTRFEEEWQSHVYEVPGTVVKLLASAGFLLAAQKMALTAQRGRMIEGWCRKVTEFQASHSKLTMVVAALQEGTGLTSEERIKIRPHLDELSSHLGPHKELHDQLAASVSALSVRRPSIVRDLLSRRLRKAVQQNFDEASRRAVQMNEMGDKIMNLLTERSKI